MKVVEVRNVNVQTQFWHVGGLVVMDDIFGEGSSYALTLLGGPVEKQSSPVLKLSLTMDDVVALKRVIDGLVASIPTGVMLR